MDIQDTRLLNMRLRSERHKLESLMADCGLRLDPLDLFVGVFDHDDNLLGGGGLKGDVIKCVAVRPEARDMAITNFFTGRLISESRQRGINRLFLFTKPENERAFGSLSFHTVGKADKAILMESDSQGIRSYTSYLETLRKPGKNGAIVMNCNPFTLGHLHLIKQAAGSVDNLYIIPVREEMSAYAYSERKAMIESATAGLPGVTVCDGSRYAISAATFPSYFIKQKDDATDASIRLDLDIFIRHIAPALGVSVRFAGTEPSDIVTRRYNELMQEILPEAGISVKVIERLAIDGDAVSASSVRKHAGSGNLAQALKMLPQSSIPFVLAHQAADCLMAELHCTPKPGLVDESDNGSHTDMDLALMEKSIRSITPWFAETVKAAHAGAGINELQEIGRRAEAAMLKATNGVNTHKGAIFSMMLALAAAADNPGEITPEDISSAIRTASGSLSRPAGTNGSNVTLMHGIPGALDNARSGYRQLFSSWLPFYRSHKDSAYPLHLTLLKIMSEIDDTNVYHRGGAEAAVYVKRKAAALLEDFSEEKLQKANSDFIKRNISPGGAADMLALTMLIDRLTAAGGASPSPGINNFDYKPTI